MATPTRNACGLHRLGEPRMEEAMIQEQDRETPHVDVRRGPDGFQVEVDAAGVRDVIVRAQGHTLVIDGQRPAGTAATYLMHERARALHRELELPAQTDMHRL